MLARDEEALHVRRARARQQLRERRQVALAQLIDAHLHLALGARQRHGEILAAARPRPPRACGRTGTAPACRRPPRTAARTRAGRRRRAGSRSASFRARASVRASVAEQRLEQRRRARVRQGHDHRLGAQRRLTGVAARCGCTSKPAAACARSRSARQPSRTSTPARSSAARGGLADRLASVRVVKADVAGVGARQQARAGTRTRRAQATPRRRAGSASAARSGPTARDRLRALAVARRASRRASRVRARCVVGVEPRRARAPRAPRRGAARRRQVRVARERAGQVQRRRQRAAAQHRGAAPGLQHRDLAGAAARARACSLPSRSSSPR